MMSFGDSLHDRNLFAGKYKKYISKCRQLKIIPRVLSVICNWCKKTWHQNTQQQAKLAALHRVPVMVEFPECHAKYKEDLLVR